MVEILHDPSVTTTIEVSAVRQAPKNKAQTEDGPFGCTCTMSPRYRQLPGEVVGCAVEGADLGQAASIAA